MKHILLVDDNVGDLKIAKAALETHYKVTAIASGEQAIRFLEETAVDLILLDIMMPKMDGFAFVEQLKLLCLFVDTPVIFLTASSSEDLETRALALGVADFVSKPYVAATLLSRVELHLEVNEYRKNLVQLINEKTRVIEELQDALAGSLAQLIGGRDGRSSVEIKRLREYLRILCVEMLAAKIYPQEMTPRLMDEILRSAALHDIGKVRIEDKIISKPDKVTNREFDAIKLHVEIGGAALQNAIEQSGAASFLYTARDMELYHHEKWDGTGYLQGLSGEEIPLCARIMAIVDVYNALTSSRPYRPAFAPATALEMIAAEIGKSFDPMIGKIFIQHGDRLATALMAEYA